MCTLLPHCVSYRPLISVCLFFLHYICFHFYYYLFNKYLFVFFTAVIFTDYCFLSFPLFLTLTFCIIVSLFFFLRFLIAIGSCTSFLYITYIYTHTCTRLILFFYRPLATISFFFTTILLLLFILY